MTDIEQKALALVAQLQEEDDGKKYSYAYHFEALCRAIEQHEAFRQEVSDAVEVSLRLTQGFEGTDAFKAKVILERFIIAKPDPLVEALQGVSWYDTEITAKELRAAIEKRGGKIVWGEG